MTIIMNVCLKTTHHNKHLKYSYDFETLRGPIRGQKKGKWGTWQGGCMKSCAGHIRNLGKFSEQRTAFEIF